MYEGHHMKELYSRRVCPNPATGYIPLAGSASAAGPACLCNMSQSRVSFGPYPTNYWLLSAKLTIFLSESKQCDDEKFQFRSVRFCNISPRVCFNILSEQRLRVLGVF